MGALDDQVAIVTGAGSGIGRAAALALSGEGAAVVLAGRRPQALRATAKDVAERNGRALVRTVDLSEVGQACDLAAWTERELGRIDVLVNNAGINSRVRSVCRTPVESWDRLFAVNSRAPMALTQAVLPGMLARGGGTIVAVGSFAAVQPSPLSGAAYSASKAALRNYVQSINAELRNRGIRACVINPGEVDTPILDDRPLPPDAAARATMIQPEDIAAAILFCATMPARTLVEEIHVRPTFMRDMSRDQAAALDE